MGGASMDPSPRLQMDRVEKEVRLTYTKRRTHVSVIREHYLRDDISCKAEKCCICDHHDSSQGVLSAEATHYAIPDVAALSGYLEVFEHPGITQCVLLESVLNQVRSKVGRQSHKRAKALLSSPTKKFVIFSNEHFFETFSQREDDEANEEWQQRLVFLAGIWYTNHLQVSDIKMPIVIVTPHPLRYSRFNPNDTVGLSVVSVGEYLRCHWPALTDVHNLCHSLADSIGSKDSGRQTPGTCSHLPDHVIREHLKKGLVYSGRLKVSNYHPRDEAFVTPLTLPGVGGASGVGSGDIFIAGSANRNRAIDGDTVAIKLLPRAQWQPLTKSLPSSARNPIAVSEEGEAERSGSGDTRPSGVVVGILSRPDRLYVASFDDSSGTQRQQGRAERVLVYPYDAKIPRVRISTRQADALRNHRIVIHIDSWEAGSQYPNGHFVRSIGPIGDIETETAVILIEHQLAAKPFSKAMLEELPSSSPEAPWKVDETEVTQKGRRDLRHTHLVMSIDPKGCEDVDDALSVRHLGHGHMELGVHIADVSSFVRPGSMTDLEARERSTTVYLADRRYDMLPPVLSADICSLLSNVDRYAVSVIWELDENYNVKKVWYGKTVIRSRYKLAYETAQGLYDGEDFEKLLEDISELQVPSLSPSDRIKRLEELRDAIKSVVEIARVFKERRGGLELEGVEIRVAINDKDETKVEDLLPKQPLEMHEVIAECMIIANHWVAKKIQSCYPTKSLLRMHPSPSQDRFALLRKCAERKGFSIKTHSNKALARSLDECDDPNDPDFNRIMRYLAIQVMIQAHYISTGSLPPEQYHHYGLDLDLYTHFTSPIRRYSDLVVHRQLLAAVETNDTPILPTNTELKAMAEHMNKKHRSAQLAQIASTDLFQGLYFLADENSESLQKQEKQGRHEIDGIVINLRSNGIMVFSLRYGIRAPVPLRDKHGLVAQPDPADDRKVVFDSGTLVHSEDGITVSYPRGQYTFQILDSVRVRVTSKVSHAHGFSLSLRLLHCGPAPRNSSGVVRQDSAEKKHSKKKLIEAVREEVGQQKPVEDELLDAIPPHSAYQQSDSSKSLYCTIQKIRRLSLQPVQT